MIDRKKGPPVQTIKKISMPEYSVEILDNGTELITVNLGTQELTNIEIIHKGGRLLEDKKGTAKAVARLLKEGTANYTTAEIADKIDFYGASIATGANLDFSYIKVFTLTRYFLDLLPLLIDIRYRPTFPEEELIKHKENSIEKLKVELIKNDVIAYRTITEELYGVDHPYGYNSNYDIYQDLTREDLITYFEKSYGSENCTIILSGKITPEIRQSIIDNFGSKTKKTPRIIYHPPAIYNNERVIIPTEDKNQSTVKMGFSLFNRNHKDYNSMYILNTILGGYFGSRLMRKIREEKGYTYGIYSSVDTMIHDGYFSISTDVNNTHIYDTIDLVYEEIEKLCNNPISKNELDMVKNYINGNLLNLIDGPFRVASMTKVIQLNDLSPQFFENLSSSVSNITTEELTFIAKQYFQGKTMKEVIVGNPE